MQMLLTKGVEVNAQGGDYTRSMAEEDNNRVNHLLSYPTTQID